MIQPRHSVIAIAIASLMLIPSIHVAAEAAPREAWDLDELLPPMARGLMADPMAAPARAEAFAADAHAASDSLAALVALAMQAGAEGAAVDAPTLPAPASLAMELARAYALAGDPLGPLERVGLAREVAALPSGVADAAAALVAGANAAHVARGEPWGALAPEDLWFLVRHAEVGAAHVPTDDEGASVALLEDGAAPTDLLRARAALARVDLDALFDAHALMAQATDLAIARLKAADAAGVALAAPGDVARIGSPYGDIVVSGEAAHLHDDDRFISIDLGGDDTYVNRAGGVRAELLDLLSTPMPPNATSPDFLPWVEIAYGYLHRAHNVSVSIDVDGRDVYDTLLVGSQGFGGFGGFGALVDLGRDDDVYSGTRFAQGAGQVGGAGFLVDDGGRESYWIDRQGQAYAQDAGAAFLVDASGVDSYDAFVLAQGTGYSVNVLALLVDGGSDDAYTCTGVLDFSDSILPVNAARPGSICHAAGFGGFGALVDAHGDDVYQTASSFQAMALIGAGILVDGAGYDRYLGGEWSNAMAVLGAAVIVDGNGDDEYSSVQTTTAPWADIYVGSNGEGYVGVGVLADGDGDDSYLSVVRKDLWLPQFACGAGCAYGGGAGVLIEGGGNDVYVTEVGEGAGIMGSGILLDAGGDDAYVLTHNSTRGQGFAQTGILNLIIIVFRPVECYYGVLWDLDGSDTYTNPLVDFGARGNEQYWGQGEFGRGMDGHGGTAAYLTSAQFRTDAQKIAETHACETLSAPLIAYACAVTKLC